MTRRTLHRLVVVARFRFRFPLLIVNLLLLLFVVVLIDGRGLIGHKGEYTLCSHQPLIRGSPSLLLQMLLLQFIFLVALLLLLLLFKIICLSLSLVPLKSLWRGLLSHFSSLTRRRECGLCSPSERAGVDVNTIDRKITETPVVVAAVTVLLLTPWSPPQTPPNSLRLQPSRRPGQPPFFPQ